MAGTYTPSTEDATDSGLEFYQDVQISPATLHDGSLAQRFDTRLYPSLGKTGDPAAGTTAVALVCNPNPPIATTTFTLTATVTAPGVGRIPSGTVQFKDGATNLGAPVALDATGVAVKSVTGGVASGAHSFTAVYSGDSHVPAATSSPVAVTVA